MSWTRKIVSQKVSQKRMDSEQILDVSTVAAQQMCILFCQEFLERLPLLPLPI